MMKIQKIYDLSQPVFHNCPGWPTYEMTKVDYEAYYARDQFMAERIAMNVHTGTHVDAPFHFFPELKSVDELPVESFQGEAVLLDLSSRVRPAGEIGPELLDAHADRIHPGCIVILYTGWCRKRGYGTDYGWDWPYLGGAGAAWLKERGIKGVGIDTLSLGGWYEGTGRPCHEVLLPADIWILEEVYIPDELLAHPVFYLCAFPIKLKGFSGAPVRAVGMLIESAPQVPEKG